MTRPRDDGVGILRAKPPATIGQATPQLAGNEESGLAAYVHDSPQLGLRRALVLNPRADWNNMAELVRHNQEIDNWSTDHPLHVIFHEFGHAKHEYNFFEAGGMPDPHRQRLFHVNRKTVARVGTYAARSYREFVAEVFAMKAAGVNVPSKVQSLYRKLGGPELEGSVA